MRVADFDFELPPELIAQAPLAERSASRLLHLNRVAGTLQHHHVTDLPSLLRRGDLVVMNDTRVFPARLLGHRDPSGGAVECLLVSRLAVDDDGSERWTALVHPGQKLKPGARVRFDGSVTLHGEILERHFFGRRVVRLWTGDGSTVSEAVDALGHIPLPPYIKRFDNPADRERYQTVYARERGSIAAPTAGLHFTPDLFDSLDRVGVEHVTITLHVGYGTFQPIRVDDVEAHKMETERFHISERSADAINRALSEGRRVVAIGTTTTRALESVAREHAGRIVAGEGETDIFIFPGFQFRVIGGLFTNFHLPKSSLLMLVSAFAGRDRVLDAYREAVARGYRFYSYGDAMVIT